MTVLEHVIRSRVQCDVCRKAWAYVDGNLRSGLIAAGWVVHGQEHSCPRCSRKARTDVRQTD